MKRTEKKRKKTMKLTETLKIQVQQAVASLQIANLVKLQNKDIVIEYPADKSHGDFATSIALSLFGKLKQAEKVSDQDQEEQTESQTQRPNYNSPRELAQAIADELNSQQIAQQEEMFSNISIAGPGFINFTLSDAFLLSKMGMIIKSSGDMTEKVQKGKKVIVEFTDPNPFKELHIGHMYSNTVGESISRMYENLGATVVRACYQGDVGMHVSKSIWGMKHIFAEQFPDRSLKETLDFLETQSLSSRVNLLGKAYASGATAYSDDIEAKESIKNINYLVFISAQENLKESTGFEPVVDYKKFVPKMLLDSEESSEIKKLYMAGRSWSLKYFDQMYERIGMSFDEFFFESQVGEYGYQIVQEFLAKGVFEKSNNAIIFPGSKYGLHDRVFINSLGLPTYEAKELGLAPEKYRRFKYDTSIVITGNEINEYFKVLLQALNLVSPELRAKTIHISHGMVRLPEGKMSSRTGKILSTQWLIDEAVDKIKIHMEESRPELGSKKTADISEIVGLGAIKYAFLKQSVGKDISFSFDESLSFTGNSGPYMQYTYVRCLSVLAKAQNGGVKQFSAEEKTAETEQNLLQTSVKNLDLGQGSKADVLSDIAMQFDTLLNTKSYLNYKLNDDEKDILRNLNKYSDIVELSATEYAPHHISSYLYELASSFNTFYANNKIVSENFNNDETTQLRLLIVIAVANVVKHGLNLLGIQTVEQM